MKTREFNIVRLEERIAPTMKTSLIPSVDTTNNVVDGAEHGLNGLSHNHAGDLVSQRHGAPAPTT